MKKMIYLLAVAMVFSGFSFKPAGKDFKIVKHTVAFAKKNVKKKFSNIVIYADNPQEVAGYKLKLTLDFSTTSYTFDIPQYGGGSIGSVPQGSYTVDIWNPYDSTTQHWLQIGSPGDGTLGLQGASAHMVSVLMNYDQTVSIDPPF